MAQAVPDPNIDVSQLSFGMQLLIAVMGIAPALRLCKSRGGTRVYVPTSAEYGQELRDVIADDVAFLALIKRYQGERIEVPKIDRIQSQIKRKMAKQLSDAGWTQSQIALELSWTERWVRHVIHDEDDRVQQSFFD